MEFSTTLTLDRGAKAAAEAGNRFTGIAMTFGCGEGYNNYKHDTEGRSISNKYEMPKRGSDRAGGSQDEGIKIHAATMEEERIKRKGEN